MINHETLWEKSIKIYWLFHVRLIDLLSPVYFVKFILQRLKAKFIAALTLASFSWERVTINESILPFETVCM